MGDAGDAEAQVIYSSVSRIPPIWHHRARGADRACALEDADSTNPDASDAVRSDEPSEGRSRGAKNPRKWSNFFDKPGRGDRPARQGRGE
jgi:hypothetical protein